MVPARLQRVLQIAPEDQIGHAAGDQVEQEDLFTAVLLATVAGDGEAVAHGGHRGDARSPPEEHRPFVGEGAAARGHLDIGPQRGGGGGLVALEVLDFVQPGERVVVDQGPLFRRLVGGLLGELFRLRGRLVVVPAGHQREAGQQEGQPPHGSASE